jgi:ABC-type uncharacterized transport system involved in gliding motility auxiliary subunit
LKSTAFFIKLRTYNPLVLAAGLLLMVGGILTILIMDTTNWWNLSIVILGLIVLGMFVTANLAEVKEVGKRRTTVARANLAVVAITILIIVGGLNYIVSRHPIRFDLTSNKFYSLADQTLDALQQLKQDVTVTFCTTSKQQDPSIGSQIQRAQALLEEYSKHSTKFHLKVVDMDRNPTEAKRLGIHEYNTVVFESGDNRKDVLQRDYLTMSFTGRSRSYKFQGEEAFTAALLKMSDTTHLTFYFTLGHGERELNNPQIDGLNLFNDMLEKQNYTDKTLDISQTGKIPDDAAAVAVIGPTRPFQPAEVDALEKYLQEGGKLVLCLDPTIKTGLDPLLKEYGVKLGNDLVVDSVQHNFMDSREVIPNYLNHPIVEKLASDHINTLMPSSRSVQKADPTLKGVTQTVFMQTSGTGYGVTDGKNHSYRKGLDTAPPVPLAIACEWVPADAPTKKTRLVVFGTSSFLANHYVAAGGDLDVGLNTFNWVSEQENKISIHPKEEDNRMLQFTNVTAHFIMYLTIFILPLIVLVTGTLVWYRRRSL